MDSFVTNYKGEKPMEIIEECGSTLEEAMSKMNWRLKSERPKWTSGPTIFKGEYGAWHIVLVIEER